MNASLSVSCVTTTVAVGLRRQSNPYYIETNSRHANAHLQGRFMNRLYKPQGLPP